MSHYRNKTFLNFESNSKLDPSAPLFSDSEDTCSPKKKSDLSPLPFSDTDSESSNCLSSVVFDSKVENSQDFTQDPSNGSYLVSDNKPIPRLRGTELNPIVIDDENDSIKATTSTIYPNAAKPILRFVDDDNVSSNDTTIDPNEFQGPSMRIIVPSTQACTSHDKVQHWLDTCSNENH